MDMIFIAVTCHGGMTEFGQQIELSGEKGGE